MRRQQGDLADEVAGVRDGRCVPTATTNAWLEHRREFNPRAEGFDCGGITVGRDLPAKRRRHTAVAERLALGELVHKPPGHLRCVVVESQLFGYRREKHDVLVAVGHDPVGKMLSQNRDGFFERLAGKVQHSSELPQQPAGEGVLGNALVDEPEELAQA